MFHIFHKWTRWKDLGEGTLTVTALKYNVEKQVGIFIRQVRECQICGAKQLRDAKSD